MSPPETAARSWGLPEVNPSDVVDITVVKSVSAIERFGSAYESGVVIVTLNQKGTDAWRQAAAVRKEKPGP